MIVQPVTCPVFVGRSDELEALGEARRALSRSRGSVVLVSGDAGIGKSRLLAHFIGTIARDSRPRNLASAECSDLTEAPFAPFRDLIAKLRDAIAFDDLPEVARAAIVLLSQRGTNASGASGSLDRAQIFSGVTAFLLALGERRATTLTIEDLHWADRSSLDLLAYLAPRIAKSRVLVVATYRSDEVAGREPLLAALSRLARESNVVHVALEPFGDGATRELLGFALGRRASLPSQALEAVVRRSEGNPFFAEELLKDVIEKSGPAPGLPLSIRASIAERLARLEAHERRVVEHAAVLGVPFEPALLAATLGVPIDDVLPALRRARDLNLIVEEERGAVRFRFRHALTRQAVYDDLLIFDVRRTHARLLAALETLPDAERYVDALAHHAWEARDLPKTLLYGERAGEAALALRALPEASAFFERALEAADEPATRARLYARAGEIATMRGELSESIALYERAFAIYRELLDFDACCDVVRAIATNRNNMADPGGVAYGVRFLDEYGDRVGPGPRDNLLALLARLAMIVQDNALAATLSQRIERPDELPPRAKQNHLNVKMETAFYEGDRAGVVAAGEAIVALLDDLDPFNAIVAGYNIAPSAWWFGDWKLADRMLARIDAIEANWSFPALLAFGAYVRCEGAYLRGELALARDLVVAAQVTSEAAVAADGVAIVAPLVAMAIGDASLVRDVELEIYESARRESSISNTRIVTACAAWRTTMGRRGGEGAAIAASLASVPRPQAWLAPHFVLAALYGDDAAVGRLRELAAMPLRDDDEPSRAGMRLALAILDRRAGRDDAAIAAARFAANAFRDLRWPLLEARALETAGDESAALAIYERCGAQADAARLRPERPRAPASSGAAASLTERELAVARAIARGSTNAAIAESMNVSVKTIEKYVSAIFIKLGVAKRTQVVALFAREE